MDASFHFDKFFPDPHQPPQTLPQGPMFEQDGFSYPLPFHEDHHPLPSDHQIDFPLASSSTFSPIHDPYFDASSQLNGFMWSHTTPFLSSGPSRAEPELDNRGSSSNNSRHFDLNIASTSSIPSGSHQTRACIHNYHAHHNRPNRLTPLTDDSRYYPHLPNPDRIAFVPNTPAFRPHNGTPCNLPLFYPSMGTSLAENEIPMTRSDGGNRVRSQFVAFTGLSSASLTMTSDPMGLLSSVNIDVFDRGVHHPSTLTSAAAPAPMLRASCESSEHSFSLAHPPLQQQLQVQPPYDHLSSSLHPYHQPANATFLHFPNGDAARVDESKREFEPKDATDGEHGLHSDDNKQRLEPGHETSVNNSVPVPKLYSCMHCPKVHLRPSRLEACINKHNNVKPYICDGSCEKPYCSMAFYGIENLNRHQRKGKWTCEDCGLELHPSNKHRHMKRLHFRKVSYRAGGGSRH